MVIKCKNCGTVKNWIKDDGIKISDKCPECKIGQFKEYDFEIPEYDPIWGVGSFYPE